MDKSYKVVWTTNGNYGRIVLDGSDKERIALAIDEVPDTIYLFHDKHARKIGWYMLLQGFINPIRNLFKK